MKYPLSTAIRLLDSVHMERINEGCCERCGHKSRMYEQRPYWYKVQEGGKTSLRHNQKYVAAAHDREADRRHESIPSRLRRDQPDELAWILAYLMADDLERFFDALRSDPEILLEKEIWDRTVMTWFKKKLDPDQQIRKEAQTFLKKIGGAVARVINGKVTEITDDEEVAIVTSYEKLLPICQNLNKTFKKLWKLGEYSTSRIYKKEAQGRLAKELTLRDGSEKGVNSPV